MGSLGGGVRVRERRREEEKQIQFMSNRRVINSLNTVKPRYNDEVFHKKHIVISKAGMHTK